MSLILLKAFSVASCFVLKICLLSVIDAYVFENDAEFRNFTENKKNKEWVYATYFFLFFAEDWFFLLSSFSRIFRMSDLRGKKIIKNKKRRDF